MKMSSAIGLGPSLRAACSGRATTAAIAASIGARPRAVPSMSVNSLFETNFVTARSLRVDSASITTSPGDTSPCQRRSASEIAISRELPAYNTVVLSQGVGRGSKRFPPLRVVFANFNGSEVFQCIRTHGSGFARTGTVARGIGAINPSGGAGGQRLLLVVTRVEPDCSSENCVGLARENLRRLAIA